MPIVFIHGVNTREGYQYRVDQTVRDSLLRRLVLEPLSGLNESFARMAIINPYWGEHGVHFRWGHASLPEVDVLESLGPDLDDYLIAQSDIEWAAMYDETELKAPAGQGSGRLEALGTEDSLLKVWADRDLPRFMDAVLSPAIYSEAPQLHGAQLTADEAGLDEALLLIAADEAARDPAIRHQIAGSTSAEDTIQIIQDNVNDRVEQLANERASLASSSDVYNNEGLESLGVAWISDAQSCFAELLAMARDSASRAVTKPLLVSARRDQHARLSRFLGDVFVYLQERGNKGKPGPIVSTILSDITRTSIQHPDEPLIVITHSMGGNIFYDILTYYASGLKVDAWISVGGQVGHFEEMKLFKASDKAIIAPHKVTSLKPHVRFWLNVYDPMDVLAFRAAPIFADVDADVAFSSGATLLKSHGAYFKRPRFYALLRDQLMQALA